MTCKEALFTDTLFDNKYFSSREESLKKSASNLRKERLNGIFSKNSLYEVLKKSRYGHCFHHFCDFHILKRRFYPYAVR